MKIDTSPCKEAVELFERMAPDVDDMTKEYFIGGASQHDNLPNPLETSDLSPSESKELGEGLIW